MSMTVAEYIIKFGVDGLDKLNVGALGFNKISDSMRKALQSGGAFSRAAKDAGVILNGVNSILGVSTVNYTKYDKATGLATAKMKDMKVMAIDLNGALKQVNLTMEKGVGGKTWRLADGTAKSTNITQNAQAKLVPEQRASFAQRLFGQDDKVDVAGLIKRAAVTIPVWFAMRNAMTAVFSIIPEGIQRFKDLDSAIAEMKILTSGSKDFTGFSDIAKQKIDALSQATGKSIQEVKKLYIAFSETGIDATTSFAGMEVAAKGSIATMADSYELARVLGGALNNLGDTIEVGATKSEKLEYMMALTNVLFKDNAGKVDEYAEALKNSVNAASNAGVSFKDLITQIATLHTAMQLGAVSGNAIRIALSELSNQRAKVEKFLGRGIKDEEFQNYELLLTQVIGKLKIMKDSGNISGVNTELNNMFGQKAQRDVQALLNNWDKFQSNKGLSALVDTMEKVRQVNLTDYLTQMDTFNKQLERSTQILPALSKAFIAGLFGVDGKDAVETLKKLNDAMVQNIQSFQSFGKAIKDGGIALGIGAIASGTVSFVSALQGIPGAMTTALVSLNAFVNSPAVARMLVIASAVSIFQSLSSISGSFKENDDIRLESAKQGIKNRAGVGSDWSTIAKDMVKDGTARLGGMGTNLDLKNPKVFDSLMETYRAAHQEYVTSRNAPPSTTLNPLVITGKKNQPHYITDTQKEQELSIDKLRKYGLDDIQIQKAKIGLLIDEQQRYDALLKLQQAMNEEAQKYNDSIKSSIKDSILGNLQGKGNNLFNDLGNNFKNMFQENISKNLSSVIMSSGIGDVMGNVFGGLDDATRKITDPIIKAHQDGGKAVHDWIAQAFAEVSAGANGSGTNLGGATAGNASMSSSTQGQLPGVWGSPFLNRRGKLDQPMTLSNGSGQQSNTGMPVAPPTTTGSSLSLGQIGYGATAVAGGFAGAASGVSQIRGGGAKNISSGIATTAGALGGTALALGTIGAANFWNPVGWVLLAIAAVAAIVSLFMKSAKQNSTQVQTNETRVSSKIDVSNKKLELINKNLIALKNTMETYALATSSYFSEKNGTIDSQFALSTRRAF